MRTARAFALLRDANPVPTRSPSTARAITFRAVVAAIGLTVAFVLVAPAVGVRVPILDFWASGGTAEPYEAGTWGPSSGDEMMHRTGREWRRP